MRQRRDNFLHEGSFTHLPRSNNDDCFLAKKLRFNYCFKFPFDYHILCFEHKNITNSGYNRKKP